VFTIIYLKQTMFLGHIYCSYYIVTVHGNLLLLLLLLLFFITFMQVIKIM